MITSSNPTFPNELYYITFLGGTGGNLIANLLYHFIYPEEDCIDFLANGSAHNHEIFNDRIYTELLHGFNERPIYSYLTPTNNHTNPMIEIDHAIPEWPELFFKFPNCRAIVITVTPNETVRIVSNLFFKIICGDKSIVNDAWEKIKINHSYMSNYQYPDDVPIALVEKYVKEDLATQSKMFAVYPFIPDTNFPKDYKIYPIAYYDIVHNPDKVLSQLEHITGREIPKQVVSMYRNYLELQDILIKTKMPWVSDK